MPPRIDIDERLRQLRAIRDEGHLDKIRDACLKHLADASNLVIAEAVKLIRENEIAGTEPALLEVWKRLIDSSDPIKADRGCTAKAAIIETLGKFSYDEPDFYIGAINYRQMEPAFRGAIDTAENVRGGCAFALARSQKIRIVDKLNLFVGLLHGSDADRLNAVRAITDTGSETAIPLLRQKLMTGDSEIEVLGACMSGLLELAPIPSIRFIVQFLNCDNEEFALEAAASLGLCGKPEAIAALISKLNQTQDKATRRSLLLSIGLSRDKSAVDFLIPRLESDEGEAAIEALRSACIYQDTQDRIRKVLGDKGDVKLLAAFNKILRRGSGE